MIKAIIFDCFGVLTAGTWKAFMDSLPETADVEAARDLNRAYDAGIISKEEFLQGVKEATGHEPQQVEELLASDITKNIPLLDYIRDLRGRGYKIGMLSNIATNWIRDVFLTPEEGALFDDMVMSFEVGMVKPDPRLFRLACERLGAEPTEVVLVDDIDRYCVAAKAEGLQTVLYTDFKQTKQELENILRTET
jgi:putative hydrolase of the HAD superfamily